MSVCSTSRIESRIRVALSEVRGVLVLSSAFVQRLRAVAERLLSGGIPGGAGVSHVVQAAHGERGNAVEGLVEPVVRQAGR